MLLFLRIIAQLVYLIIVIRFFSSVLTNRLYPIVDRLIRPNQLAFLKGRNILDAVVTAHEIHHHVKLTKEQGLLLKLDFEKDFDNVDWSYLLSIFQQRGFSPVWVS
jgi:Reverse transcriptase (RNA-dependent DNA polymerase)